MSGQDPSGMDSQRLEALAKQLGDLERQSNDLAAAIQRSASVRRLLVLSVVGVLVVFIVLYFRVGKSFLGDQNMDELMLQLNLSATNNSDEVIKEFWKLVENTRPTVVEALNKQFQKDMPTILAKLGEERENLALNLRDRLDARLQDQFNKALQQHRGILREEFNIEDDETLSLMIHHFEGGFQPLVKQYYGDKISNEFNRLYKTWDEFPIDDSKRSRKELEEELYRQLIGLMLEKVNAVASETDRPTTGSGSSGG